MNNSRILTHFPAGIKILPVRLFRDLPSVADASKPLALAIGNFDGMHLGHQALTAHVIRRAAQDGMRSGALSFEPHPLAVISGKPVRRLGGAREKIRMFAAQGVDDLFLLRFTRNMAMMDGEAFAAALFDRLGARYVAVGGNFRFGRGRSGDVALLQREAARRGAVTEGVPLQSSDSSAISSGRIRECLRLGEFAAAERLLGRPWTLEGRVTRGRGFGRELGFPTANLRLGFIPACEGIFAAAADLGDGPRPAAVSVGFNPTLGGLPQPSTEAHFPGYDGDLYGRRVALRLMLKIRDEKKYDSTGALRDAIAEDVRKVLAWWAASGFADKPEEFAYNGAFPKAGEAR